MKAAYALTASVALAGAGAIAAVAAYSAVTSTLTDTGSNSIRVVSEQALQKKVTGTGAAASPGARTVKPAHGDQHGTSGQDYDHDGDDD